MFKFKFLKSLDSMTRRLLTVIFIFIVIGVMVVLLSHLKIVSEEQFDNNANLSSLQEQQAGVQLY